MTILLSKGVCPTVSSTPDGDICWIAAAECVGINGSNAGRNHNRSKSLTVAESIPLNRGNLIGNLDADQSAIAEQPGGNRGQFWGERNLC